MGLYIDRCIIANITDFGNSLIMLILGHDFSVPARMHFLVPPLEFNKVCRLSNNRPPSWLSGTSGDWKQEYYKSWPYTTCMHQ